MMSHTQLRQLIAEAFILFALGAILVIGGFFLSSDNASKRIQNEYHTRFGSVLDSFSYEKVKSKALKDYPEIKGVYIGYSSTGIPEGYVVDLTVQSPGGQNLSMLVSLEYESTRIKGLSINKNTEDDNAYVINDDDMKLIKEKLIGKQIPIAFVVEDKPADEETNDVVTVPGLKDGVYYAQRLFDDRNRYIDYVEMEIENGIIKKVKWDAFSTDKTNQDRSEASLRGAYVISGLDWATQSYNVCHALLSCQDPDRLAMKSDGTTDIVSGVTCDIRPFVELAKECIEYSRASYEKDAYMKGLDVILMHLYQKTAAELEYVNEDGHVVFSFEKTPEIYTKYNDSQSAIGYYSVMEIEASIKGIKTPNSTNNNNPDNSQDTGNNGNKKTNSDYDSTEDGLNPGGSSDNQIFTDSMDNLPMSEMATFIQPVSGKYDQTRTVVKACNTCYKFLKEYLNWKV